MVQYDWMLRQVRKSGEQNLERNITHYTFTKSEKGAVVNMQQAVFMAHCPYISLGYTQRA